MRNDDLSTLIDDLGKLQAKKTKMEKQEENFKGIIKAEIKRRKKDSFDGFIFRFTIVQATRKTLNTEKVIKLIESLNKRLSTFQNSTSYEAAKLTSITPKKKKKVA